MRKPVPMLDSHLSGDEFLKLIVDSFQSVVFGTVDQNGDPHTNVADIEVLDGNRLIFATTYQKPFYQRLKASPHLDHGFKRQRNSGQCWLHLNRHGSWGRSAVSGADFCRTTGNAADFGKLFWTAQHFKTICHYANCRFDLRPASTADFPEANWILKLAVSKFA